MADPKSGYKLEQNSPAGRPGLESFKSEEDGLYYFHFNDEAGQPVLFSQGYATARQRTAHRNALRKRMHLPEAYQKSSDKGAFFFTLLSAKGTELARSQNFDQQKERDAALQTLTETPESKTANPKPPPKKQAKPAPLKTGSTEEADSRKSVLSSRFRYNLIFRRMEEAQPLIGEIEYPVLKKRATFQGLDRNAIIGFIVQYLPEDTQEDSNRFKNEEELDQEIKQVKAKVQSLNKALSEAKKNAKDAAKDYEERIAKERSEAKATEAALLEKIKRAQTEAEKQTEQLSAYQQAAQARESALNDKIKALLQKEKELEQQRSSALGQLKRESAAAEALKKELAAIRPEKSKPDQPPATQAPAKEEAPQATTSPEKVRKPLTLLANNRPTGNTFDPQKTRSLTLQMPVRKVAEQKALESFKADVIIKSLRNNQLVSNIRNHYGTLSADRKSLIVPVPRNVFSPGKYRLSIVVTSVQPPYNRSSPKFEGELVIEVV